ncbi:phosphoserine aminotransferase [Sistotremastrum suecicum HHB10207 ss-3]|uniref:phosphoserine transaminase n=1 Tax=Sistotremastrum suecicum HHB10207 ss-3 TaxID=1314776 RepID=A0A166AML1_9AGAM|nr:phosphoserine aminotransferase [Sistotremastrum suecicum HHB10207 ss-3]
MDRQQVVNFGAGPSALPTSVLEKAAKGLLNYNDNGIGLVELSHRSKDFAKLNDDLESIIRTQLDVPSTHHILFTQGGGSGQFSSVVMNLLARHTLLHPDLKPEERVMDYIVTGSWSKKAYEEANRLAGGKAVANLVVDARRTSKDGKSFDNVPQPSEWKLSPAANTAFIYYCENETVDGVQFSDSSFPHHLLENSFNPPLVADYSSSFMSRPIPRIADHALIFAGAQKNIGPSGLTILIVRNDVLVDVDAAYKLGANPVPLTMAYKTLADSKSLYNTPPMFAMYVSLLVLQDIQAKGGLGPLEEVNRRKQAILYEVLEGYEEKGILKLKVQKGSRSWMNVTFEFVDKQVEKAFLESAESKGLKQLKGHRSVGGIRVSLYNAITEEQVKSLISVLHASLGA